MVIVNAKARITDGTLGVTTRKAQVVGVILTTNKHSIRADYVKSNCYDYYIEGCPPQNEEGTLDACEILVNYLNQLTDQPTFLPPYVVSHKYLDALAQRVDKNQQPLSIQVVRAVASDKFWHACTGLIETDTLMRHNSHCLHWSEDDQETYVSSV